ncbi:MAG: enoyl-CoA hydratase/isomerase family protein [Candidatus Odinarchaeota archaeon]
MSYGRYDFFDLDKLENVLLVQLTRPKVNGFSEEVFEELQSIINAANADSDVISVIIASGFPDLFTVEADNKELASKDSFLPKNGQSTFELVESSPKPFIIAMKGTSHGSGIELACACEIRIATEDAKFAMPGKRMGISPSLGATQRLSRLIGHEATKKLVMTGEPMDAREALQIGLIDEITPTGGEIKRAIEIAESIADYSKWSPQPSRLGI